MVLPNITALLVLVFKVLQFYFLEKRAKVTKEKDCDVAGEISGVCVLFGD